MGSQNINFKLLSLNACRICTNFGFYISRIPLNIIDFRICFIFILFNQLIHLFYYCFFPFLYCVDGNLARSHLNESCTHPCNVDKQNTSLPIHSFDRRKSIFNWLLKSSANICFLQETYSTQK